MKGHTNSYTNSHINQTKLKIQFLVTAIIFENCNKCKRVSYNGDRYVDNNKQLSKTLVPCQTLTVDIYYFLFNYYILKKPKPIRVSNGSNKEKLKRVR